MTTTLTATTGSGTTARAHTAGGRWVALGLLVSAQFVVMLDTSIVNVALPSIQTDLDLRPTAITWVVNAYVLSFGGLLLLAGRAADLFGSRRLFVGGSILFAAGTLLAASASSAPQLIGGRVVQGVGAAGLNLLQDFVVERLASIRIEVRPVLCAVADVVFPAEDSYAANCGGSRFVHRGFIFLAGFRLFELNEGLQALQLVVVGVGELLFTRLGDEQTIGGLDQRV